ncbi:MAG: hypothetical protein JKX84_01760 [Flavobacteriales bacterium]|nr:hypothetical protein [Flavobacteriales bacterium]
MISVSVSAQEKKTLETQVKDTTLGTFLFRASYAAQIPVGDYADRYGFTNSIGASLSYKTRKNWFFSLGGHYIFGNKVAGRDSLLSELLTSSNIVIGSTGTPALINISHQGYMLNFQVGKIFPWAGPNPNSGFIFTLGGGFMEYWIRYRSQGNTVPQLLDEYRKGYDRLSNGLFLQQFIGYHLQGSTRLLNFYGGFEFTQGFTGNRRSYDIPTRSVNTEKYLDLFFGIRIGWMMPFYKRNQEAYYYY